MELDNEETSLAHVDYGGSVTAIGTRHGRVAIHPEKAPYWFENDCKLSEMGAISGNFARYFLKNSSDKYQFI